MLLLSVFPLVYIFTNPNLPHTSDGLMHVARSAAYLNEAVGGQFPIRWAHQFNYGYGTPIFNFFNPLPYAFGALLLSIGVNLATTLKIGFVVTHLLSAVFMLLFAKTVFKSYKTAVIVTIMYQYVPFRLVEMHTRGDIGCLYSYMTFPLVLFAINKFVGNKWSYPWFFLLAIATALLPLGHNINGFVFFVLSLLYVLFKTQKVKEIVKTYFAMGIGLLSISYFLLPALLELRYLNGYIFSKHLFYMHFPQIHKLLLPNITNNQSLRVEEVAVQIGLFNVVALAGFAYLFFRKRVKKEYKTISLYLISVSLFTFFIMLPISKPLWENFEYLRQFQFPWRFLSILIFVTSVAFGLLYESVKLLHSKKVYILLVTGIILSTIFYWGPYQGFMKIDENYYRNFPGSTNYFAEVNTIWMEREPQEYPKERVSIAAGSATIKSVSIKPELHNYKVSASNETTIIDRTYFYPGWKVYVNGVDTPIEFQDPNYRGLITFKVPSGENEIRVVFEQNKTMKIGNMITLTSVVAAIFGWILFFYTRNAKAKK